MSKKNGRGEIMKIFGDKIKNSSDYNDESKWVEYNLLIHLNNTLNCENIHSRLLC